MPYLETSWLTPEGRNGHAQRKKWQETVPRKPVFGWWVLLERVQAEAAVAHPHPSEESMWGRAPYLSPLWADRDVEQKELAYIRSGSLVFESAQFPCTI